MFSLLHHLKEARIGHIARGDFSRGTIEALEHCIWVCECEGQIDERMASRLRKKLRRLRRVIHGDAPDLRKPLTIDDFEMKVETFYNLEAFNKATERAEEQAKKGLKK